MREEDSWCHRFVGAWLLADPGGDANFVRRLAQRSFAHEGEQMPPALAAREHLDLLRRIKATTRPPRSR
ncbi:hypothetical protein [Rhizobacter sp. Root404]|uniref:hypothetical protein n=1 Tax=Rhizobacter sp. Root404 TaxID=1736528 RepID=UPI0006FE0EEE|nr:hypothetical protein [Rhizobacter sp. Root404]KQW36567.1 hypothetical protein ASC76_18095 [Rhizobacter sp. Root404]